MIYRDHWGLPVTRDMDGGDTAAILGTILASRMQGYESDFDQLDLLMGLNTPLRHPDSEMWYGRPWRFSRDQLIPLLAVCVVHGRRVKRLRRYLLKKHAMMGFCFAWNSRHNYMYDSEHEQQVMGNPVDGYRPGWKLPDLTGPEVWGLWIRCYGGFGFIGRLVLTILDIENLINTLLWNHFRQDRISRNHLITTLVAAEFYPTPVSILSAKILNWNDLLFRWWNHCEDSQESNTAPGLRTWAYVLGLVRFG